MTIPITGQPPVPDLSDPATFNTKALNLFTWMTGSMLTQFNNVDAADWFGIATKAQAEAGIDNTKILTALRTKEAIYNLGDVRFATAAQGILADAALPKADKATTGEARAGSNIDKYMTPNVTAAAGYATGGKIWQDVLGARSRNTPYRNTLGYPIEVCIQAQYIGSSIQVSLDGSSWTTLITNSADGHIALSFPVPNETYYRLVASAGVLTRWAELK